MSQSGLAIKATRADNFYFPPDYEERHGTINKINKAHTLGKRAKYISDGIIIIRFEMPFHVRCDKCLQRTAQGVRFNARKKKVGSYYTTPIYEFTFLCKKCENPFVIRTDPEHAGYSLESGCTKCAMEWDPKSAGSIEVIDPETRRDMENDPMFKLEKTVTDEGRVKTQKDGLRALIRREDELHGDDYTASRIVRKRFREESKIIEEEKRRRERKHNFGMMLADVDEEDTREAARLRRAGMFKTNPHHVNTAITKAKKLSEPIFGGRRKKRGGLSSSSSSDRSSHLVIYRNLLWVYPSYHCYPSMVPTTTAFPLWFAHDESEIGSQPSSSSSSPCVMADDPFVPRIDCSKATRSGAGALGMI
ncbi:hypothetical protein FOZ62_018341, partial [Perkinsus olseni]